MAHHEIETHWMGKMKFNALLNGHTITMDAPERAGGEDTGPIPKPFVLAALSGCTGMDIVSMLRKANLTIDKFYVNVIGELGKQHPLEYVAIHIVYDFEAHESLREAVLNVVRDSQEKYCGVISMLKKAVPVTWEVYFNKQQIFCNSPYATDYTD